MPFKKKNQILQEKEHICRTLRQMSDWSRRHRQDATFSFSKPKPDFYTGRKSSISVAFVWICMKDKYSSIRQTFFFFFFSVALFTTQITCLHLTLSTAVCTFTPTISMSSITTSINPLLRFTLDPSPSNSISYILDPKCPPSLSTAKLSQTFISNMY